MIPILLTIPLLISAGCGGSTVPVELYNEAVAAKSKAEADLAAQIELNENLNNQLATMETDLWEDLEEELTDLRAEINTKQARIDELGTMYPPRNFGDVNELRNWLASQPDPPEARDPVEWLSHGCELQHKALEDGYIINVECTLSEDTMYYTILCTAILEDDSYYYWDPDNDNIQYWMDASYF